MNHLFEKENKYYLFDGETLKMYKIPNNYNAELNLMSKGELLDYSKSLNLGMRKCNVENHNDVENQLDYKNCKRLIINLTHKCNLACKYCYANGGDYHTCINEEMDETTAVELSDRVYDIFPNGIDTIQFFGGEPLLNVKIIRLIIDSINRIAEKNSITKPQYTIVTNGTIMNDEILELFEDHFHAVTISVDGSKVINDKARVFANSDKSVYECIAKTIKLMNDSNRSYYLALESTITPEHISSFSKTQNMESIMDLNDFDADFIEISPVFTDENKEYMFDNTRREDLFLFFDKWIDSLFHRGRSREDRIGGFGNIMRIMSTKKSNGNNCGASLTDVAIDIDGTIYPCFMFIGHKKFNLGNIKNISLGDYRKNRKTLNEELIKSNQNSKCSNCWANKLCTSSYGHCIGARFLMNGSVNEPIDLACDIGKTVIERVLSNITESFGGQDEQFHNQ